MAKKKYTFYQWCIDNNRKDLLDRWDYELTGFGPNDITHQSNKDVFFKCPNGVHDSSKRKVFRITGKNADQKDFKCKECLNGRAVNFEDLTGKKFGELTVLYLDENRNQDIKKTGNNQTYWICRCSCGNIVSTYAAALKDGRQVTCGDKSNHNKGENNSNWKGGITPELLSERTSKEYIEWRNQVYAKDWYTCQCCGAYGDDIKKNAHHIKNFSSNKDSRYDVNVGICLCDKCHHIKNIGSFHNIYGTKNNNECQLEEYINNKRKELGIQIPFSIDDYMKGKRLNKDSIKETDKFIDVEKFKIRIVGRVKSLKRDNGFLQIKPIFRI